MNRDKIIEDMAKAIYEVVDSECDFNADTMAEAALNASGLLKQIEDLTGALEHLKHLLPDHPCADCESIIDNALKTL